MLTNFNEFNGQNYKIANESETQVFQAPPISDMSLRFCNNFSHNAAEENMFTVPAASQSPYSFHAPAQVAPCFVPPAQSPAPYVSYTSMSPEPHPFRPASEIFYEPSFLSSQIGKNVMIEFLLGDKIIQKEGRLTEAGHDYIILCSKESGYKIMCDKGSIKFVTVIETDDLPQPVEKPHSDGI